MTILLIKSLIWGDGEKKEILENVIDEDIDDAGAAAPPTPPTSDDDTDEDTDEDADKDADEDIDEDTDEDADEDTDEDTDEDADEDTDEYTDEDTDEYTDEDTDAGGVRGAAAPAEDETLECEQIHSRFEVDFYKEIRYVLTSFQFNFIFYSYMAFVGLSMAITTYNWSLDESYTTTPNLPIYEKPFSVTPFVEKRSSAIAHLPYVPSLLLGISYASPEMCVTLDPECNSYAHENRLFLWIQFALQLFTSVGGQNLTDGLSQQISIGLSFILLYNFFNLTTSNSSKSKVDSHIVSMVIALCVPGFLTIGLLPVMLVGFIVASSLEFIIPGAFSLLTPKGRLILLYSFLTYTVSLLIETIGCVSHWHVVFDLLFWQVLGSVIDVMILSPRPGRFLLLDDV